MPRALSHPPALMRRVIRAARATGAAMPAVDVSDSTIELHADGALRRYLDRDRLRAVQTPQAFRREVIELAFAKQRRVDFPDDASVVRTSGRPVAVVEGESSNRKITTADELEAALRHLDPKVR
jgi:2-C-methyl-D-erythritol 4-phosphate cytidylyltransferase